MALKKPIKIGKYEVVGLLGKGGMGVVYKANDPLLGRSVAIKMMTTLDYGDNPDLLQRFYREAQSTGSLHHRNIVTVYELGDHEGSPFLVMEYLEGETLDAIIQSKRPLPLFDRINYILEVCDGLAYAHQRSVVHRDIKPGNIMVLKDSGVKIVDFGIAHIGNRTVTRTGQLLGSLPYMSPEQISGKQVDPRSDIFSLGVVFYQLLTGHLPFDGETPAATLLKIIHERPRPLAEYSPSFPAELEEVLLRALAKDPEERYASAQDLTFDLVQIRGRIQQEIVEEHLNEAELLLAREEFVKAREKLADVLKIDRHNTRAVELSRATQQRIQQQELGEQVRQLRTQAEEAYHKEQFDQALDAVQKAISLHPTDRDLQRLRSSVQEAKTKTEKLQRAVKRAEAAYEQGELDSAKQAIEEAIEVAPDDLQVKSLRGMIQRDWDQRAQRLQVLGLIEEARKEIASRNFTVAIEVLRKAEAIDPAAPEVQSLIDAAKAAREQERRRKALAMIKREIEGDLDRDDFQLALTRAETALADYPEDRGLRQLKELAEKQRLFAERKYFIQNQVSRARKLLESGRTEEVLQLLQSAREKVGSDPQLDSLIVVARETSERQRIESRKLEFLRAAKDRLRLQQYDEAIQILESASSELGSNPEIDDLLQFTVEQQSAKKRRETADAAAEKAQNFIKDGEYEKAVAVLETALQETPDEELRLILVQARQAAADHRRMLEDALANSESMLRGQRPLEAVRYLEAQPASLSRDPRFAELLGKARSQQERLQNIEQRLEKARTHFARDEFDAARSTLEECIRTYGRTPDANKLIIEIEQRQSQIAAETLEKALAESRVLMSEGRPGQAMERLSSVQTLAGNASDKLIRSLQALQQEAASAQARKYKTEVDQLLAQGDHAEADASLRRAQAEFPHNRDLQQLAKTLEQAVQRRADAEKLLENAHRLFEKQAWNEGADVCIRAGPLLTRNPVTRSKLLALLESAASAAADRDWRSAEYLLQSIAQLQPTAEVPAGIAQKISSAKQEESIQETIAAANQRQVQGDVIGALDLVDAGIKLHPVEARLLQLQEKLRRVRSDREEIARRERENNEREEYVTGVRRRLQAESTPEAKVGILEEAILKYPGDAALQLTLDQARELERNTASLAAEAKKLEESRNYEQAIRSWSAIGELGVSHPDAEAAIARLQGMRTEARAAAKAAWLNAIRDALGAFDMSSADLLLTDAQKEFPKDAQLLETAALRDKLMGQRQEGTARLAKAESELRAQHWQAALDLIRRTLKAAEPDPAISKEALRLLLEGGRSALSTNLSAAQALLDQATRLQPESPDVASLRASLERQEREEIVKQRLADVRAEARAGNTEEALSHANSAYSEFPDEPRFIVLKQELERTIAAERAEEEQRNRLLEMLSVAQRLRQAGDLRGALGIIEEGLRAFPKHSQFLEMKRSVETSIREIEKQRQREKKQQEQDEKRKLQQEARKQRELEKAEKHIVRTPSTEDTTRVGSLRESPAPTTDTPLWLYLAIAAILIACAVPIIWKLTSSKRPAVTSTVPIRIETTPQGAKVTNIDTGQSCVTPNCTIDLSVGEHVLRVEMPGYQPLTKSISVGREAANPVLLALVPAQAANAEPSPGVTQPQAREDEPSSPAAGDQKQSRVSAKEVLSGEQVDWKKVKDSQNPQSVEAFLKHHPSGAFAALAHSKLEDLTWAKAVGTGTAAAYSQYLEQYPNGKYSQQGRSQLADLEWHGLESSNDTVALQNFLKKYPSGADHDKALSRLDDLTWQQANQSNQASMQSYLGSFPEGRHANEARKKIDDINRASALARGNEPEKTPPAVADDNKLILDVLGQYQKSYEAQDVQGLQRVWPGMGDKQIKGLSDFFGRASGVSLQCQVSGLNVNGDHATLKFTQTLRYSMNGNSQKSSAKIVMQLDRLQPGAWRINSIR